MNIEISKINIKRFRSINDLTIHYKSGETMIICGANNIGKTNVLRALNLFFSVDKNKFNADLDIPYNISEGSRGKGYNSEISVHFIDKDTHEKYIIIENYSRTKNEGNILTIKGKSEKYNLSEDECKKIISNYNFIFIESNNIDLPQIISNIFKNNVLTDLDKLRKKQQIPLKLLEDFFKKSQEAVKKIESDINSEFNKFICNVEGLDTSEWECKIVFPEFDYLREAISKLVTFTLKDTNDRCINTKGSGIQRMILLSLISYVSKNSKEKVIWGIDEPEVFLQPLLQKRVFNELKEISKSIDVIITTHSPHFIDIYNLDNTYLLSAKNEKIQYKRRPNEVFIKVSTYDIGATGIRKIELIKNHMGIEKNDSWVISPYNLLVEGECDKEYIIALSKAFNCTTPNIFVAGGAEKIKAYLEFLKEFSEGLDFKPTVVCILDHDEEGKRVYRSLERKKNRESKINIVIKYIHRCDGVLNDKIEYEVEDFMYSDIIFNAANKYLKNKKYNIIKKNEIENRFSISQKNNNILKYITEIVKINNPTKEIIDFEASGIKKYLCSEICIQSNDYLKNISIYGKKQPDVKKFIESICELE
ncbi:ATP-binding protein [Clostridium botulinum]|nr:ATP-binding protein [Clostridium botulinum]